MSAAAIDVDIVVLNILTPTNEWVAKNNPCVLHMQKVTWHLINRIFRRNVVSLILFLTAFQIGSSP